MNDYARATGRSARPVDSVVANRTAEAAPLAPAAQARADEAKAFVLEHMPDAIPFIRALHAEGLIDGWRSVTNCKLISTP